MSNGTAVNLSFTVRCTNKTLMSGMPPAGGTAVDQVNCTMQLVPGSDPNAPTGTLSMTYLLSNDVLKLGNYYSIAMTDGTAPASKEGEHHDTFQK